MTCDNGHSLAIVVQHPKFDVLAEIACQAILDGYPREAVASFQASLERFYEYFFFVLSDVRGIPIEEAEKAWKAVAKQSERQLGLYVAAYLFHFGEPPALLPNAMVAFRNRVIHQGDIPEEDEAIAFGQAVLDITYVMLRDFSQKNIGACTGYIKRELAEQAEFRQPGDINVNAVWRLIYSYNVPGPPTFDLAQEIKERREARALRVMVDAENAKDRDRA
ncbi:MAG TPA: hypothetical protein VEC11_17570 [Allosphingosinicella sp.]|nr:hypothetical protein [Allosphingosinicella sp.]